mmetsp:Transcript_109661/g.294893  ORF Transcript_109661/g.294893 Transcript_109661/m.294893 type:complete len:374 (-) Transcript_109661:88-1209(-)
MLRTEVREQKCHLHVPERPQGRKVAHRAHAIALKISVGWSLEGEGFVPLVVHFHALPFDAVAQTRGALVADGDVGEAVRQGDHRGGKAHDGCPRVPGHGQRRISVALEGGCGPGKLSDQDVGARGARGLGQGAVPPTTLKFVAGSLQEEPPPLQARTGSLGSAQQLPCHCRVLTSAHGNQHLRSMVVVVRPGCRQGRHVRLLAGSFICALALQQQILEPSPRRSIKASDAVHEEVFAQRMQDHKPPEADLLVRQRGGGSAHHTGSSAHQDLRRQKTHPDVAEHRHAQTKDCLSHGHTPGCRPLGSGRQAVAQPRHAQRRLQGAEDVTISLDDVEGERDGIRRDVDRREDQRMPGERARERLLEGVSTKPCRSI